MTYKYKVGDKVRIRNDLTSSEIYSMEDGTNSDYVDYEMKRLKGKIAVIEKCNYEGTGKYKIQGSDRYWTDGMFARKVKGIFNGLEE